MPVGGEKLARQFYGELLGLRELRKPPHLVARGGVWFQCGRLQLHLGIDTDFRPAKKAHPALLVIDLAELLEALRAAGFEVKRDSDYAQGFVRAFTSDPSAIALSSSTRMQNPSHRIREEDSPAMGHDVVTISLLKGEPAEMRELQRVIEEAPTYAHRITGTSPGPAEAQSTYTILPEGKSHEDKFVFGVYRAGGMVGCADLIRGYPDAATAVLGLLLVSENHQRRGIGSCVRVSRAIGSQLEDLPSSSNRRRARQRGGPSVLDSSWLRADRRDQTLSAWVGRFRNRRFGKAAASRCV